MNNERFEQTWSTRSEKNYVHWTKGDPKNQIQLAFRKHWETFREIMANSQESIGRRVLEVGCGRGSLSAYFAESGYDCTLLDISPSVIDAAKKSFADNELKAEFTVGDAFNLPYQESVFDIVFSIGLFEHFEDVKRLLQEQIRVLKSGGLFIAYIVPEYSNNIQTQYEWMNQVLKCVSVMTDNDAGTKPSVFRTKYRAGHYTHILKKMPVKGIQSSGIYPLPMISTSIEFPFTLLPPSGEEVLVSTFLKMLEERARKTHHNPWLCREGYGQASLVWCVKE